MPPPQSDLAQQTLKDPYIFDFLTLSEKVAERDLEYALLEKITDFLLELGIGFAFLGRNFSIEVGGDNFSIDLLFYHIHLHCYVVIDLKMEKFKPEFAGKMNFYLAAVDTQLRQKKDAPSIGLILCKEKNRMPAGADAKAETSTDEISPQELLEAIEEFKQHILDGEFYDEERSGWAYEMEERSYFRSGYDDYYGEDIDFADEEYVHEAVELLEDAKGFFRQQDTETAYKAYLMLFDIFENPEFYEGEEYFIYGFSFESAIDSEVFSKHKTIFLRCQYLQHVQAGDFQPVYRAINQQREILISDIIEIDRSPLPQQDKFLSAFGRDQITCRQPGVPYPRKQAAQWL